MVSQWLTYLKKQRLQRIPKMNTGDGRERCWGAQRGLGQAVLKRADPGGTGKGRRSRSLWPGQGRRGRSLWPGQGRRGRSLWSQGREGGADPSGIGAGQARAGAASPATAPLLPELTSPTLFVVSDLGLFLAVGFSRGKAGTAPEQALAVMQPRAAFAWGPLLREDSPCHGLCGKRFPKESQIPCGVLHNHLCVPAKLLCKVLCPFSAKLTQPVYSFVLGQHQWSIQNTATCFFPV